MDICLQSNGLATEQIGVPIERFTGGAMLRIERAVEWPRSVYAPSNGGLHVSNCLLGGEGDDVNGQSNGFPHESLQAFLRPAASPPVQL